YILHCLEAGIIASHMITKEGRVESDIVCGAILHDTIEDTDVTYETLKEVSNEKTANLVQSQSEDKSKQWLERKSDTTNCLTKHQSKARETTTLADKLSNMRSISRDYDVQQEKLWSKFNAGKASQHWNYNSISNTFTQVNESNEYKEFKA